MDTRASWAAPLALAYLLFIASCYDSSSSVSTAMVATIGQVGSALEQKAFGAASTLSAQLTATNPRSVEAWFAAADAKVGAGSALTRRLPMEVRWTTVCTTPRGPDADRYFDAAVRSPAEYLMRLARFGLSKPTAQAGDVSNIKSSAGTIDKAGYISVNLPNSR